MTSGDTLTFGSTMTNIRYSEEGVKVVVYSSLDTTFCDNDCQWLAAGQLFIAACFRNSPVDHETNHFDMNDILYRDD